MDDAIRQCSHLCRSCLERTFQYPPYAWNVPHVGIAFDQQRIGNASVVPDRFDTLTAAVSSDRASLRMFPVHVPCTADAIFPYNVIPAKKTLRNASNASDRQPSGMVLNYAVCFFGVECFLCRAGRR